MSEDTPQQIIDQAKEKAIKKVEHASDEAKDLVLDTAKHVEIQKGLEVFNTKHEQIMFMLGGMKSSLESLVVKVGIQNGRVTESEKKYYELDGSIAKHNAEVLKMYNEKNEIMNKMYDFMNEVRREKQQSETFWGNVKLNWINYALVGLTAGFAGTFVPIIWMWLKHTIFK